MGSLTNMLLAQAAPANQGIDESSLSGLSPEAQAAIRALNQQGGIQTMPAPAPSPTPTPAPPPAQASPGIMGTIGNFLMSLLPSTKSLATPQQPAGGISPEELLWRKQHPGQPYPGTPGQ